jgi:AbrB family looped-hinge helix DNA binding protein
MSSRTVRLEPPSTAVSRIGQRRQVVIPKVIFEALQLREGDFVEVTAKAGRVFMKPKKLVDADEVLTKEEERKVRKGEAQLKRGQSKPWRAVKHGLGD